MRIFERIHQRLAPIAPYFPFLAALIALGSWWVSSVVADRAERLERKVATAVTRYEDDRRLSDLERQLRNLEKQSTRIELRGAPLAAIEGSLSRIEQTLAIAQPEQQLSSDEEDLLNAFTAEGDRHYWTQVLWEDISLVYWERGRLIRDLNDIPVASCRADNMGGGKEWLERVAGCVQRQQPQAIDLTQVASEFISTSIRDGSAGCLSAQAMHVYDKAGAAYSLFRGVREQFRKTRQELALESVSIMPPDFGEMQLALPLYGHLNAVVRQCLATEVGALGNEVSLARQRLIFHAEHVALPERRLQASIAGWIAAILYALSAVLGIYGKWNEVHEKRGR